MSHNITIALGSNLGERLENLHTAIQELSADIQMVRQSSVYETTPWGYLEQPDFLNQVIQAETKFTPKELLRFLKQIETNIGRKASFRYGPRAIDMDILFYDELVQESPDLSIPHPRLAERAFVLVPLAEIDPKKKHPALGATIRELLANVDTHGVRLYAPSSVTDDA